MKNESSKIVATLDVRAEIEAGRHPCDRILATAQSVGDGESFRLIAPFEPVPLYRVLGAKGFEHQSEAMAGGDWNVLFVRRNTSPSAAKSPGQCHCSAPATEELEIDTRGMEPPDPMSAVLLSLEQLEPGKVLRVRTDRHPAFLLLRLDELGCSSTTNPLPDGSHLTIIRT